MQAFPDLGLAKTPVCVRPHIQRPATVTQLPNCPNHRSKTVSTQPQREGSVCFCFGTRTRPVLLRGQALDGLPSDSSLRISSDLDVPTEHSPSFSHPILCPPCHLPTWILHKQPNASVLMFMFQHQHSPPGQLRRRNQSGRENAMKNQSRKRTRGAKGPKPCDGTLANEFPEAILPDQMSLDSLSRPFGLLPPFPVFWVVPALSPRNRRILSLAGSPICIWIWSSRCGWFQAQSHSPIMAFLRETHALEPVCIIVCKPHNLVYARTYPYSSA